MSTSNTTQVLADLRDKTFYSLANDVPDIAGPDSEISAGAKFLMRVRDSVVEALEWQTENDGRDLARAAEHLREDSHELADGSVPVYTYDRWLTFVDLAAWNVDIEDYGSSEDMTGQAGVALYEVARTLVDALCEWVQETWADLHDEGEQDDDKDQDLDSDSSN
jgi:hypothetical protein